MAGERPFPAEGDDFDAQTARAWPESRRRWVPGRSPPCVGEASPVRRLESLVSTRSPSARHGFGQIGREPVARMIFFARSRRSPTTKCRPVSSNRARPAMLRSPAGVGRLERVPRTKSSRSRTDTRQHAGQIDREASAPSMPKARRWCGGDRRWPLRSGPWRACSRRGRRSFQRGRRSQGGNCRWPCGPRARRPGRLCRRRRWRHRMDMRHGRVPL
jgi:hypothetical protein